MRIPIPQEVKKLQDQKAQETLHWVKERLIDHLNNGNYGLTQFYDINCTESLVLMPLREFFKEAGWLIGLYFTNDNLTVRFRLQEYKDPGKL